MILNAPKILSLSLAQKTVRTFSENDLTRILLSEPKILRHNEMMGLDTLCLLWGFPWVSPAPGLSPIFHIITGNLSLTTWGGTLTRGDNDDVPENEKLTLFTQEHTQTIQGDTNYDDVSYLGLGEQHPPLPPRGQRELETVLLGRVHGAARHLVILSLYWCLFTLLILL